ncbi:MAG TPA: 6-phosphogluconolactonase, partial [Sphingomicrobium sp.]|nr:6-phosphogluconolactonase [Sphingomicrobium sp.]
MIEAEFWDYDSIEEMADAVAGDIGFIVESAIEARGNALLALPGGKTPVPIYQRLAKAELPWKRVTIIPGDERLVAMDNDLSNVRALAKTFLPAGARVIPVTGDIADVKLAGNSADARLQDLPWPPDVVLLGMGADGHTASIFPGPDLDDALNAPKARRMVGVTPDPMPPEAPVGRV